MECKVQTPHSTLYKESCSFPNRRGDATGKPETQDETCFAASPIDTAKAERRQRLKTRHVGAAKRAFRARLFPILTLGHLQRERASQLPI